MLEKGKNFSLEISPNSDLNLENLTKNSDFEFLRNLAKKQISWQTQEENLIWKWCNETAI